MAEVASWWRRPRPEWLPSIPLAATSMLGAGLLAMLVWEAAGGVHESDFVEYYVGAHLGLREGWAAPYHPLAYVAELRSFGQRADAFTTSPPVLWLVAPFTALPLSLAYRVWLALLLTALLLAWWQAAPGSGGRRRWQVLGGLALYPVYYGLWEGQAAVLVAALFVLHWRLLPRSQALAGVALGMAALMKPQMVFLVPLALLLSGRWRAAAVCAATVLLFAGIAAAALGPDGLQAYRYSVELEIDRDWITRHTLIRHLPDSALWPGLAAAIAVVALIPALFNGACSYERAAAAAVLGGLLMTPYLNVEDLTILVPCAWLIWRSGLPAWAWKLMVVSYLVVALDPGFFVAWGALPVLAVELSWLILLSSWSLRLRPATERI